MKTSELTGDKLDWAVAKSLGLEAETLDPITWGCTAYPSGCYNYSTRWAQGGPIIEREKINTVWYGTWLASMPADSTGESAGFYGPTPLIAAMRCYVASKLGDEVEIPKELI
jgi:hypothetical protein